MKTMLVSIALLASCEGRCRPSDAVGEVLPSATCATEETFAICIKRDVLYVCSLDGITFHKATCEATGRITRGAEAGR